MSAVRVQERRPGHPQQCLASGDSEWVLVVAGSTGQNRSALAAVRAAALAGYRAAVTCSGPHSLAAASRFCARQVPVPPLVTPGFADAVAQELANGRYLTVLPASDAAIYRLSAPGRQFINKATLAHHAAEAGLQVPSGWQFDSAEGLVDSAPALEYPVVVKPMIKTSTGHKPAERIDLPAELARFRGSPGPFIVQRYLSGQMHSVCGVMWQGRLIVAVHQRHLRLWPRACGDACAAVTTEPRTDLERLLERLLAGYDGVFQAEFVGDSLLDVNPRVYASLPLALSAGANLVGIFCSLLRGGLPTQVRPRAGVRYRWWEGEVRHHVNGWLSWGPAGAGARRSSGEQEAAARLHLDPGPTLARTRFVVGRLAHLPTENARPLATPRVRADREWIT